MKIDVIVGNNLKQVSEAVISSIDISNSLELENFVVVPDRFSLIAEKLVFNLNNINSTFNIKVVGISKLASYFSSSNNIISTDESRLKVFNVLKELNLNSFKPSLELSSEVYNIISQLKSNNISPKQFEEQAKTEKLLNIAKVYKKYEDEKNGVDQSDLLSNLVENMDIAKVSACNFYFAGFDSLTEQGGKILEVLMLNAKRVVVGCIKPNNQTNYYIYDEDVLNKVNKISNINKISVAKTFLKDETKGIGKHILNNLFAIKHDVVEANNKLCLMQFEKPESEAVELAKIILNKIKTENKKFSDFNVYIGNLEENYLVFEEIFNKYEIPFFVDCSVKIQTLAIYSFFKSLFELAIDFNNNSLFNFLLNPYLDINKKQISSFYNYLLKHENIDESLTEYNEINDVIKKIKNVKELFNGSHEIKDFSINILKIIEIFDLNNKNSLIIEKINSLKFEKIYLQIFNKMNEILKYLEKQDFVVSADEFFNMFLMLFGEKEISSVPISIDCVFVGGEKSFFESRKTMFVANARQGCVPKVIKDLSLLCDEDIKTTGLPIYPTVRMINERNKQKLLFDLSCADELFVSYSEKEFGEKVEKSELFLELQKIFLRNGKKIEIISNFFEYLEKDKFFNFLIQNENDFYSIVLKMLRSGELSQQQASKLIDLKKENDEKTSFANELYKKLSPTSIENYYKCPFKHFFDYGLKIRENETNNFDGRDYGNYFHMIAEKFIRKNLNKIGGLAQEEIINQFEEIVEEVEQQDRFKLLKQNKQNNHIFAMLKKEAKTMVLKINYEQKYSNFIAKYLEKPFSINLGELKLNGVVDRVDVSGDCFRVVDYKSGEVGRSLKDVYMGTELQLFVYMIAMETLLGLKPIGGFYFPIGSDFHKDKTLKKFCLDGFVLNEQGVLKDLDRRFGEKTESDIVFVKLRNGSTLNNLILSTKKNTFTENGFSCVLKYVNKLLNQAKNDILSGRFDAKPVGTSFETSPCRNCKLFCVCSFKQKENENYRKVYNEMTEEDFIRIVEDGEK